MEEVESFLHAIHVKRVDPNKKELMLLKETKDGRFSVKCFYGVLDRLNVVLFLHSIIWNTWTPTKVSFFLLGKPLGGRC